MKKTNFFGIKNYNLPSLGLRRYRRSLQLSKEAIQHFKTWAFKKISTFLGHFCPPGSGSGSRIPDPDPGFRIRIHWPNWIRIQSGSATLVSGEGNAAGGPHQPQMGRVGGPRDRRPGHSQVREFLYNYGTGLCQWDAIIRTYTYVEEGRGREWYGALSDWGPVLWVDLEIAFLDIPRFENFFIITAVQVCVHEMRLYVYT